MTAPWDVLPHGLSSVSVDRVTACEPGRSARGVKLVTSGDAAFDGPAQSAGAGGFPALLLLEAMAQLGGIAWLGAEPGAGAVLAGVKAACFSRAVDVGEAVEIRAEVLRAVGPLARVEGRAAVGGEEVARAELTLARQPGGPAAPAGP